MNLSPPKAPKLAYNTVHKTRWEKEKIAAGGDDAVFDKANDPKKIGNWIMGETVGKGASGRVKIARHVTTNELAAVKILPISSVDKQRISVEREIVMMKLMDHPNVLRLYDIWEGQEDLYLIFEFVEGGELFDYIVNHGRLDPVEAACWFKQIISGLAYTHSLSVSHRDLKPENLLIASLNPPRLKIADWGMAAFAPPAFSLHTSCGSPHYASPQIVNGEPYDGPSTDIWSCGVILFALLTGRLPFDDKSVRILLNKVRSGKYEIPSYVLEEGRDLIRRMLVVNVADRITMAEILDHPFMQIPTPGVTMVAPPSFHELAQPIPAHIVSPTDIDSDTMHSLRLIWRDNADDDSLRLQLISPERNLAKAFYWLLERYRERRLEQYGMDEDFNPSWSFGDGVTKPYQLVMPTPMAESSSPLTSSVPDDPPTLSTALPTSSMSSALAAFDRVGRYDGDGYSVKQRNRISKYKPVRDSVHGLGISAPVTSFLPPVQEAEQPKTPVPSSSVQELAKPKAVLGSSNVHRQESPFQASPASVAQVKHDVPKPVVTRRITFDLSEKENRGKHQSFSENVKPLERRTSVAVHNRAMKHRSGPVENVMEPMFERDTQVNVRRGHSRRLTTGGSVRARPPPLDLPHHNMSTPPMPSNVMSPKTPIGVNPIPPPPNRKRSSSNAPTSPTVPSPISAIFSTLFNWRPQSYVLQSYETPQVTRQEVERIMLRCGIHLEIESLDVWKCHVDQAYDANGVLIQKEVRFRIEFTPAPNSSSTVPNNISAKHPLTHSKSSKSQATLGYVTRVALVLERGAASALKAVHQRMRDEWRFDNPRSPTIGSPNRPTFTPSIGQTTQMVL